MTSAAAPQYTYYFGCLDQPGHYFWTDDSRMVSLRKLTFAELPGGLRLNIDGEYTPVTNKDQGSGRLVKVSGWTILAWHDYTCDTRPGSNSAILASDDLTFEQMMAIFQMKYPRVYNRQTAPIVLVDR